MNQENKIKQRINLIYKFPVLDINKLGINLWNSFAAGAWQRYQRGQVMFKLGNVLSCGADFSLYLPFLLEYLQ